MPDLKSVRLGAKLLELLQDLHDRKMFPFVQEIASGAVRYTVDKFNLKVEEEDDVASIILESSYLEDKELKLSDWTLSDDQVLIIRGYYQQHKIHEFNINSKTTSK